jgi:hypothetical protein
MVMLSVALFFLRRFARLFTGVNNIPVIGNVNVFLGGVIGVGQAVVFLFIGALVIALAITLTNDSIPWLNREVMDDTFIWRPFYRIVTGAWERFTETV